jgi:hypothetical protein
MRNILIIIFLCFVLKTSSQDFVPIDYQYYYDKIFINSIVKANMTDEFIVFQTMNSNDSIIYDDDEEKITSFLFYKKKDSIYLKEITKHAIYQTILATNDQLFNYKYFNVIGADKKESSLRFTPPGLAPIESDIIIANLKKYKFYYEFNNVGSYIEDKRKIPFRKEYDQIVRNIVIKNLRNCKFERKYNRLPLF